MWAFIWLFLWIGLIVMTVSMIASLIWMLKRWDYGKPSSKQLKQREDVIMEGIENLKRQDELTSELNNEDWYPYCRMEEGNISVK